MTSTPRKKSAAPAALALAVAAILGAVYSDEGGYVNHPKDPGGATNWGVTEKVARQAGYKGHMRAFPKHCSESATVCADDIYLRAYIERPGFLPLVAIEPALSAELVNTSVNMGPDRAIVFFQQSLNQIGHKLVVDGKMGPQTIAAYRNEQQISGKRLACVQMLELLDARQKAEYDRLVRRNPNLKVFYRGWINRRIGNVDRADCGKGWA